MYHQPIQYFLSNQQQLSMKAPPILLIPRCHSHRPSKLHETISVMFEENFVTIRVPVNGITHLKQYWSLFWSQCILVRKKFLTKIRSFSGHANSLTFGRRQQKVIAGFLFCCCYHSFYQKMSAFSLVCHLFLTGRCGRCQKNSYQYFVAVQCLSLFYHSLFFCFKGVWEYRQYHYVFKEFWDWLVL